MGDRCFIRLRYRRQDAAIVAKHLPYEDTTEELLANSSPSSEGGLEIEEGEANYAWEDEIQAMADEGLTFEYWHGEGGCYDGAEGCVLHGVRHELTTTVNLGVVVPVDFDEETQQAFAHVKALEEATAYFVAKREVEKILSEEDSDGTTRDQAATE